MKIVITKKTPLEFVRSGMDSLDVWINHNPYFDWGYHTDMFGEHHLSYPRWHGLRDKYMSGWMLRKIGDEQFRNDVWEAMKFSYAFDQSQDLYEPVRFYYNQANRYHKYYRPGATNRYSGDKTDINRKCDFVKDVAADKYASLMVEKEGQRWWEWKLEYDIGIHLNLE